VLWSLDCRAPLVSAAQFGQCLTYLDGTQQEVNRTLDNDSALLSQVPRVSLRFAAAQFSFSQLQLKSTVSKNTEIFKSNCESIERRLKDSIK